MAKKNNNKLDQAYALVGMATLAYIRHMLRDHGVTPTLKDGTKLTEERQYESMISLLAKGVFEIVAVSPTELTIVPVRDDPGEVRDPKNWKPKPQIAKALKGSYHIIKPLQDGYEKSLKEEHEQD